MICDVFNFLKVSFAFSVSTLAQKCVSANFRAHVRAQGFAKKLFSALADCYTDPV